MYPRIALASLLLSLGACTAGRVQPALAPFDAPIDSTAIVQGQTADCFLISVLLQLADKDAHYIRNAIAKRGDDHWQVRLFIGGHWESFDVTMDDLEHTYALTTDGALWPNIIEAAVQQAGVSLQYGDAARAMTMLTGEPTRAQRITLGTVSQAALHAEAGLPSVVCSTHKTVDFVPFHCFGLHGEVDGTLYLQDPLTQGEMRMQPVTPAQLSAHFAYAIHLGH